MNIRAYRKDDLSAIARITREGWHGYTVYQLLEDRHGVLGNRLWPEWKTETVVRFCEQHPERVLIAQENGRIAGYATYSTNPETGVGEALNNAVDPAFRGRGIGTALNRAVLDALRNAGMRVARVSTLETDAPARRVYENNGFQEIARTVHYSMDL
jgi:ribosomal protein S18 acetylase RimI-like enzyme